MFKFYCFIFDWKNISRLLSDTTEFSKQKMSKTLTSSCGWALWLLRCTRRNLKWRPHVVAHHHEWVGRHSWLRTSSSCGATRLRWRGACIVIGRLLLLSAGWGLKDVKTARGARLLTLKPRAQTRCVEDVVTGQLLRSCGQANYE
jgi:hypothetical protein